MKKRIKLDPPQVLVIGFATIIFVGAILLSLPIAAAQGAEKASFLDSLFTSTSAVCVTGLIVRNTATEWSMFGQVTILVLIQIGGLGFMTMATLILMLMGRRLGLRERLVLQEALNEFSLQGLVLLIKKIAVLTFSFELIGIMLLSIRFIPQFGFAEGLYRSIFHSISAFCNAGFDVTGNSFMDYNTDILVNFTLMMLIIIGGLGFTVLLDIGRKKSFKRLTLHSKVVLLMSAILLVVGFVFFFIMEVSNPNTLGMEKMKWFDKLTGAMFQSVTSRTAGFNTIDQNNMTMPSKFMTILLMFIGASPAGTGGGIKTTTFAVVVLIVLTVLKGRHEITIFDKQVIRGTAYRAVTITVIAFVIVVIVAMGLSVAEQGNTTECASFENILFESVSAFATVGLSCGLTPSISIASKFFLIVTMFAGRLGPLTLALAFSRRYNRTKIKYKYPEGKIMVG
jgi:trk system potassium uptake protein TrkH